MEKTSPEDHEKGRGRVSGAIANNLQARGCSHFSYRYYRST